MEERLETEFLTFYPGIFCKHIFKQRKFKDQSLYLHLLRFV